jgi:hypothetical protein
MFRNKAIIPRKLEQWFLDAPSDLRLREVLGDPVLQLAVATLHAAVQPTARALSSSSEENERTLCVLAGYTDFIRDLEKLARFPREQAASMEEWSHIIANNNTP